MSEVRHEFHLQLSCHPVLSFVLLFQVGLSNIDAARSEVLNQACLRCQNWLALVNTEASVGTNTHLHSYEAHVILWPPLSEHLGLAS